MYTVAQRIEWAIEAIERAMVRENAVQIKFQTFRLINALRITDQELTSSLMLEFEHALIRKGYQYVRLSPDWHAVISVFQLEEDAKPVFLV